MTISITLLPTPNSCPGTYTLDLYCRYENPQHEFREFPHQVEGVETGAEARSIARRRGWLLHRDGTGTCPKCAKILKEQKS